MNPETRQGKLINGDAIAIVYQKLCSLELAVLDEEAFKQKKLNYITRHIDIPWLYYFGNIKAILTSITSLKSISQQNKYTAEMFLVRNN